MTIEEVNSPLLNDNFNINFNYFSLFIKFSFLLHFFYLHQVYARIQSGEYKIEEGWDGIKPSALFGRPNSLDFNLVVAEPEKSTCC